MKLKDVTTKIGSGATPRGGSNVYLVSRENYALIRSQHVFDRHFDSKGLVFIAEEHALELQKVAVQPRDVLLNITGDGITFGRACIVPKDVLPACVNQHVSIIRTDPEVCLPEYLLCYLTHPVIKEYIESFNAGGSRRAITKGNIESFEVPLPPLDEQKAIAHILGTLDDKIELNRQMNQTLEAIARALFKSWFIDFDPVRAKLEGCQPAGMDAETAALFPAEFEDSALGKIPKGWRVEQLGNILEFAYGKALKDSNRRPGKIPVYGSNGQVGWHDELLVISPGIVVGRKGNPGTVTWVATSFYPIDTTFYVVSTDPSVSLHYLFHLLKHQNLPSLSADSAVPGLNRNLAYMNSCVIPTQQCINSFGSQADYLAKQVQMNQEQSCCLTSIRDSLLPKLLSGEIRIKDAEKVVEEVM